MTMALTSKRSGVVPIGFHFSAELSPPFRNFGHPACWGSSGTILHIFFSCREAHTWLALVIEGASHVVKGLRAPCLLGLCIRWGEAWWRQCLMKII